MSDLHLEFHQDGGAQFLEMLPVEAEVLILAGDICFWQNDRLRIALETLCKKFKHVVFVPGNHDYYHADFIDTRDGIREYGIGNLHVLDGDYTVIDGQRFVGATLWFRDRPRNVFHEGQLADFSYIGRFREWVYPTNERHISFLADTINPDDVVITHHVPTKQGIAKRWQGAALNRFFLCALGDLIVDKKPKWWFFGHSHTPCEFGLGKTRLVCNPCGYPTESTLFQDNLVIDV
jgi:predicted phosphodiesterase